MAKPKTTNLSRGQKYGLMYGAAGDFMSHLSHGARVRVKLAAEKQGVTVSGLLQGGPAALRERSNAGIKRQALSTINSAYKPAEADIGSRVAQTEALDEKRRTDNQFYSDWLTTQQKTADAVSASSDAALLGQAAQLHGQAQAVGDANQQAAVQQATSTPGNVSNPAQSTALQGGLTANTTKSVGAADIANANAVAQVARSGAQRATLQASSYAQAAALEARRQGDTYKALAGLGDESAKLKLSKAADTSKEVARLLDQEVAKAQNQQQTSILANKLNVQQSQFDQTLNLKKGALSVSKQNANTNMTRSQHDQMLADSKFNLDQAKYGDAKAKDIYQRQHKLGPYKPAAGVKGGGPTAGQAQKSQKLINTLENAIGAIHSGHLSQGGALHVLTGPTTIHTKDGTVQNPYGGYDQLIAQAGVEIVHSPGHRLSSQTYRSLRAIGMFVPDRWKPVQSGANASPRT